ncbi:MAG: hypothetical protein KJ558_14495 [Gammaproteobacteria bacterium]|nr:hypothetical protein [Gammaproteobacteria bacterium]MBU1655999.1 hypothetical protein [Gammaproteobacteria bacterium]MBU1962207.1 hypothetical protein [Gammaproteobacteria bacterium]
MTTGRLILTPDDPYSLFEPEGVAVLLLEMGIVGEPLREVADNAFAAGEDLMRWISFTGCSPFLRFEPSGLGDEDFCHVRITVNRGNAPVFHASNNTKPPLCPYCRGAVREWRSLVEGWVAHGAPLRCECCGNGIAATELNWRRYGGFARGLVEIFSVFPGEAVPVPALLERLTQTGTGTGPWRYFYWKP